MTHRPHRGSQTTRVCIIGDRHVIETNARRAEAILLVLSGATLQEVGDRFGITRERVRQYLNDAGLTAACRLTPRRHTRAVENEWRRFRGPEVRRRAHKEKCRARLAETVKAIRGFAESVGRAPSYMELAGALGVSVSNHSAGPMLIAYLCPRSWETSPQRIRRLHLAYRMAGFTENRPRGMNSHTDPALRNARISITRQLWWANMDPTEKAWRIARLQGAA